MSGEARAIGLLITRRFRDEYGGEVEALARAAGHEVDLVLLEDDPETQIHGEALGRIEIAFMSGEIFPRLARPFMIAVLKARHLHWLHLSHTGVDHPVFQQFLDRGVLLTNSPGVNAVPIAHTAFAGLMMLARDLPRWLAAQRERRWDPERPGGLPVDLGEQTLVILGLGRIGCELARLARSVGLRVVGVRRRPARPDDPVDELVPPERLDEVLRRADWLAITCPLTETTRGMVDARRLALLPPGARVVNVARGEIVDESALVAGLESGRIGGAYLDVFEEEPLPEGSPLWGLENTLVTPHSSSASRGAWARQAEIFLANLGRYLRGEPVENRVTARND